VSRTAVIEVEVTLNEQQLPIRMQWSATDSSMNGPRQCAVANVTLWDAECKSLSAIGLWTLDCRLEDMYSFIGESLGQLAQVCQNATHDEELTQMIYACASRASSHAVQKLSADSDSTRKSTTKLNAADAVPIKALVD